MDKKELERLEQAFRNVKKSNERQAQREAARIEADPEYQKRQADLKKYSELLQQVSGSVENEKNYRIELENISPGSMDALVEAIRKTLYPK
jgi:hypothetical protein